MANSIVDECRKKIAVEMSKLKEDRDRVVMGECCNRLFEFEQGLFSYCELIMDNPVNRIVITESGVYANIVSYNQTIKMYLDQKDRGGITAQILAKGEYEKDELNLVLRMIDFLPKDAVIFDIGANLGWYGINIQKRLENSKVYYFEPVPDTAQRLRENVRLNDYDGGYVYNIGFYDQNLKTKFYYDTEASGASSMADLRGLPTTKIIDAELRKMDDFVLENGIGRLDFIKCDVEGSELFVYKGGLNTIQKYKPVVFSEMLRKWSAKQGYHPNDIINLFKEMGYACFVISDEKLKRIEIVTDETIETNYFFLHEEKHLEIIRSLSLANQL